MEEKIYLDPQNLQNVLSKIKQFSDGEVASTTTFNQDGSISETTPSGTLTTIFNSDGTISEIYPSGTTYVTTFNSDGSITKTLQS